MWRCLNDIFGYCSGEPEAEEGKEIRSGNITTMEKKCKLNPVTCGKHQILSGQVDTSKLPESSYKHTLIAAAPEPKPSKSKKKAAAKQEEKLL